jgi:hypothetical protein
VDGLLIKINFDFLQNQDAQREFDKYKAVFDQLELKNGSKKSISDK